MAERVLVTGGAGFIGSHVTDETIKLGLETIVLDDLKSCLKNISSLLSTISPRMRPKG
jgi:UDP-glucose 4-epimerase